MIRMLVLCTLLAVPFVVTGQTSPSAYKRTHSLNVGAEFSMFNPDFYCSSNSPISCGGDHPLIKGAGVFADYSLWARVGAEGEARWLYWDGVDGQKEATYLIGPRYQLFRWRRLAFWAKFLVGVGAITTEHYPSPNTLKGTMLVYAPGASADYSLDDRLALHLDYELQKWPSFAVAPPNTHGLSPNGFSIGVVYRIARR